MHPCIKKLILLADGWIVGSTANPHEDKPEDIDILIPAERWHKAMDIFFPFIEHAQPNKFGGWKLCMYDAKVDIWPDTLDRYCQREEVDGGYLLHLGTNTLISVRGGNG